MTLTIPRADIHAIADRHGVSLTGLPDVLTVAATRDLVRLVRDESARISMAKFEDAARRVSVTQVANDLEALVDRIEEESAR